MPEEIDISDKRQVNLAESGIADLPAQDSCDLCNWTSLDVFTIEDFEGLLQRLNFLLSTTNSVIVADARVDA